MRASVGFPCQWHEAQKRDSENRKIADWRCQCIFSLEQAEALAVNAAVWDAADESAQPTKNSRFDAVTDARTVDVAANKPRIPCILRCCDTVD